MKITKSIYKTYREESKTNQSTYKLNKKAKSKLSKYSLFFICVLIMFSFNVFSQSNINNIKVWDGWKLGNIIKVSGVIKYGNPLLKSDEENRYLIVQKIDNQLLDSSRTIQISYNKELFQKLENNKTITLLGYVSGSFCGIPDFNNYDLEYWQDESFHFKFYFIVLKEGEGIKEKEK
ncbi:MAG: hypothetical protein A2X08_10325 [Bacteroidetes bacterium GWA2_32_17]|nr:MAG: hypothetical protein A2X08_10325 [Bacteroidetes bacterium GWA2_32_17]